MAKKYYGGYLLPDIEPLWNKTTYPYAYISINDAATPILGITTGAGEYAWLVLIDTPGYIEVGEPGYNRYVTNTEITAAKSFIIALDDDAVTSLSGLFSGINKETWTEASNDYQYAASAGSGPHWTNTTLYDESGNLFLEASDPVAYFDLKSWLTGYALALCGKPLPFSLEPKAPSGYRHGAIVLPYRFEWDREAFPYALILKSQTYAGAFFAVISDVRFVLELAENGIDTEKWIPADGDKFRFRTGVVYIDGAFVENVEWGIVNTANGFYTSQVVMWSNYDVYRSDGSIYGMASDPEPVYDYETT